jgi:hypothetical protein
LKIKLILRFFLIYIEAGNVFQQINKIKMKKKKTGNEILDVLNGLKYISDQKEYWMSSLHLNRLMIYKTENILNEKGNRYTVKACKIGLEEFKLGSCFPNAIKMMQKGYKYYEGVATLKTNGFKIAHAWNADCNGNHFDVTFPNPQNYDYFGIEIPEIKLHEVGRKNGTWFAALPFLEDL